MRIELRKIEFGSEDHRREIELRTRVLRDPLGLRFSPEELEAESEQIHIGAFAEGELVGCLLLAPQSAGEIKMRQVAVSPAAQRGGVGTKLVEFSESVSRELGYREIALHARESAVSFYLRLGYALEGDPFVEVTLPHRKMRKALDPAC